MECPNYDELLFPKLFAAHRFSVCLPGLISTLFLFRFLHIHTHCYVATCRLASGRFPGMLFVAVMISKDLQFRSRDPPNNTQWKHLALYMYHRALSGMDL